jgi:hypothetical protein
MMGQTRKRPVGLTDQEEEDRNAAGYTNPDIPKKETYLPGTYFSIFEKYVPCSLKPFITHK